MTDRSDRTEPREPEEPRLQDDQGLYPSGEGVSETPIHATYEAIALRNELARQLENVMCRGTRVGAGRRHVRGARHRRRAR
jgi:hypothetical protein